MRYTTNVKRTAKISAIATAVVSATKGWLLGSTQDKDGVKLTPAAN